MNITQTVQIFKALTQGPASRFELAACTGLTPKTVGKLLLEMKAQKLIYVIGYTNETDGRNRVKIYSFGDGEDAKPQDSMPQRVRSRRSYLKKTAANNETMPVTTFVGGKSLWS